MMSVPYFPWVRVRSQRTAADGVEQSAMQAPLRRRLQGERCGRPVRRSALGPCAPCPEVA